MPQKLYLILLLLLCACKKERVFEYPKDLKKITNGNLKSWLEKAPFEGLWDYSGDSNTMIITNFDQVFPFAGKFKNENNNFKGRNYQNGDIYQKELVIFKDPSFGESFVYAALTYKPEELFLRDFYSEMGNVIMSGANAIHDSYTASLSETKVFEKNKKYKTVLYWVSSNNKTYLFGFYQKKNLLFQFGFPANINAKTKVLQKLKQLNNSLGLNIKEWTHLTEEQLEITQEPKSFWKDPFYGLYRKNFLHQLSVKLKNTKFKEASSKLTSAKNVDYLFFYEENKKNYNITFTKEKTALTSLDYEKSLADFEHKNIAGYYDRKLFITKVKTEAETVITYAEIYFKDYSILKITAEYPVNDTKAKAQLFDILENLRIRSY